MAIRLSGVLLDTSVVVRHFREEQALAVTFSSFENLYLPHVALAELYAGAFRLANPEALRCQIELFLPAVEMVLPDDRTAEHYGRLSAQLAAAAIRIPQNDLWIAALALQHALPVATTDEHFLHIPGLTAIVS